MYKNLPAYNTFDEVIAAIETGSFDADVLTVIESHGEALAAERIPEVLINV